MLSSEPPRTSAPSGPHSTAPTPADIQAARELILVLSKTAKASRIYARNNELFIRFWTDLLKRMADYLGTRGNLALAIGSQELQIGGEVVYSPRANDDNFAFKLYKDGLRQLEFLQGLTPEELEGFLDIITTDFDRGEHIDRDVISLIWERDFKHIRTLSVDSFAEEVSEGEEEEDAPAEEDAPSMLDAEADQLAQALEQVAELKLMKLDAEERREYHQVKASSSDFDLRNALHQGTIFDIDLASQHAISAELDAALEETPFDLVADIFFELFRQETVAAYPELLEVALGILDPMLSAGELDSVNILLAPVRLLSMPDYARAFLNHKQVLELFRQLGRPERLEMITQCVNDGSFLGGRSALFEYISLQLPENVPAVMEWVVRLTGDDMRRAVIDALVSVVRGELEPFRAAIRSPDSRLVADIVHGMGRVGGMESLEIILGGYAHPDAKVREEALVALRSFESPRARELMLTALQDPAESVRLAALRYVAVHRDRSAGRALVELAGARAFKDRDFSEKRAVLMAIAHIQGKEAIPFLTQCFKTKRRTDLQRAAVHGLAVIGGQDVRRLLETASREAPAEVAAECRALLPSVK